jgi:spore maturation protein CgeB
VIDREITARERRSLLGSVAAKYDLSLYAGKRDTGSEDTNSRNMEDVNPGCQEMKLCRFKNLGAVDYYTEAPLVYRNSKINLNITLRSIKSGMPLRVFEIMGSGGFLLTNYQADFEGSFKAGEDYVYFDSSKDLLDKCGYYLADSNNAERMEIAKNGFEKMMKYNTYDCRVREMLAAL